MRRGQAKKCSEWSRIGRVPMPSPHNRSVYAERAIHVALNLVDEHEERLRSILESNLSTPEEKFQALVNLAHLAGTLLHEMSEATPHAETLHALRVSTYTHDGNH
jgi:hypothetical protein